MNKLLFKIIPILLLICMLVSGCKVEEKISPTAEPTSVPTLEPLATFVPNASDENYNEYEISSESNETLRKVTVEISLEYDYELPEDTKELLEGAADVSVFDSEWPIKLIIKNTSGKDLPYKVNDFWGTEIFSGMVKGSNAMTTLTRGIKRHQVGYFTVTVGETEKHYVVTPPYSERTLTDNPFAMDFASTYHVSNYNDVYNLAAAAKISGVTWVRERANWTDYEGTKGKYDFTGTKKKFELIKKAGLKNLVMLCVAPSWAKETLKSSNANGGFRKNHLSIYNLCKNMAEYYDGIVDGWELWNEEDFAFAAETAELYSGWFKSGALGLHDSGADVTVSYGGFCMWGRDDYMILAMENDILEYSDIYNFHAHKAYTGSYVDFLSMPAVSYQLGISKEYNINYKPIWITEAGMQMNVKNNEDKKPTSEQLAGQAPYIVQSTALSLSQGVSKHFWFLLAPLLENSTNFVGDFGTFSNSSKNKEPYPTLAAEAVMTSVLGKAEYIGHLKDQEGINTPVFDTGNGYVAVCWSEGEATSYSISDALGLRVTDMMGGQSTIEANNGIVTITLTQNPQYVKLRELPSDFVEERYQKTSESVTSVAKTDYSVGSRVIVVPEFTTDDYDKERSEGHPISNGTTLKIRITNLNNQTVKGNISVTLDGYEFVPDDNIEIEVSSMSEVIVSGVLKKTSGNVGTYLFVKGIFNGSDTSNGVCHVFEQN